ncbi:MAG: hypothetical protein WD042_13645 [Phycisphaeraceae bacterium]
MSDKAYIDKAYLGRVALLALMFLGFSGWFLYDGFVKYPRQDLIYREFQDFKQKHAGSGDSSDKLSDLWNAYALEKGYPQVNPQADMTTGQAEPGKAHSDSDILTQKGLGFALLPLGLFFLFAVVRLKGRWISSDGSALITSWGQRVPFDAVTLLNKARWKSKGIAVVLYTDESSQVGRLVLDDWKYNRQPITDLVKETESYLKPEQITGEAAPTPPAEQPAEPAQDSPAP